MQIDTYLQKLKPFGSHITQIVTIKNVNLDLALERSRNTMAKHFTIVPLNINCLPETKTSQVLTLQVNTVHSIKPFQRFSSLSECSAFYLTIFDLFVVPRKGLVTRNQLHVWN